MDLRELGKDLRRVDPEDWHKDATDEDIALNLLNEYPQYEYLVEESATQIYKLLKKKWWVISPDWEKRAAKAESINNIDLTLRATIKGVDVPTLLQMKLNEQSAQIESKMIQLQAVVDMMKINAEHQQEIKVSDQHHSLQTSYETHQEVLRETHIRYDADHAKYMAEIEAAIERIREPKRLSVPTSVWQDPGENDDAQDSGVIEPGVVRELRNPEGERPPPRASSRRNPDPPKRGGAGKPHAHNGGDKNRKEQVSGIID